MIPPNHKLNGLILAGGKSSRMGKDKALLRYHDAIQVHHLSNLLEPFCDEVFISCRIDQQHRFTSATIVDQYDDIGPLGGILSAFTLYPSSVWLVVACDLVLLTSNSIQQLITARNTQVSATLFQYQNHLEPLCAIYEHSIFPSLQKAQSQHQHSLYRTLQHLDTQLLNPAYPSELKNVNTEAEEREARDILERK